MTILNFLLNGDTFQIPATESEIKNFAKRVGFKVFKEETGLLNWVAYDPKVFAVVGNHLSYIGKDSTVYLPINCSSLYRMFEGKNIVNVNLIKDLCSPSQLLDFGYAFANSNISDELQFSEECNVSDDVLACDTFMGCKVEGRDVCAGLTNTQRLQKLHIIVKEDTETAPESDIDEVSDKKREWCLVNAPEDIKHRPIEEIVKVMGPSYDHWFNS